MNEIILNVEGMMCEGCEKRIEKALKDIKEVERSWYLWICQI